MIRRNVHELLELDRASTSETIRNAYLALAATPDTNRGGDAAGPRRIHSVHPRILGNCGEPLATDDVDKLLDTFGSAALNGFTSADRARTVRRDRLPDVAAVPLWSIIFALITECANYEFGR